VEGRGGWWTVCVDKRHYYAANRSVETAQLDTANYKYVSARSGIALIIVRTAAKFSILWNSDCRVDFCFCILGAFEKFRKVAVNFVLSVCLSVRMEKNGSHWKNFCDI
jgi:hypothetical protein